MKFHATIKGKSTSISIDDLLIDYLGAWALDEDPKAQTNALEHYKVCKDAIKRLCEVPGLPSKNVSQFIQGEIIKLIAAPHLKSIIEARGPRYVPPNKLALEKEKREAFRNNPDNQEFVKKLDAWKATPEELAAIAERKRVKAARAAWRLKKKADAAAKSNLMPAAPSKAGTSRPLQPTSSKGH